MNVTTKLGVKFSLYLSFVTTLQTDTKQSL